TGTASTVTVFLDANVESDTLVALSSSNTAVVTLPASTLVAAGTASVPVPFTAGATGVTKITATLGSSTKNQNVTVQSAPNLSTSFSGRLQIGAVGTMYLTTDVAST